MSAVQFTCYGHSCFAIETGGVRLIFDPFIRPNELARGIDFASLKADYILLSHGHWDHTADAVELAKQTGATVIGIWEAAEWMKKQGHEKVHPLNIGGRWKFPFGTVKMVQAAHSSSFGDGSYAGAAAGFIIETPDVCFYYSGDTGLFTDMKLFGKLHDIDFAILPIGDNFTMNVEEARLAAKFLKVNTVVGVHFDTFGFIRVDHAAAQAAFAEKGRKLLLPAIGETLNLNGA